MGTGSTAVRQWRKKRVLMRPEAAFPYVSAAEGAQHPPKKPPRSTPCRSENNRRSEKDRRHEIIRRSEKNRRNEIIPRHEKTRPDAAFIIRGTRTGKNI